MKKTDKSQVVDELTERLKRSETLIVADFRGLKMKELDGLRSTLISHGASFTVVKNTLGRRAAEAAGADQLLALLEGPTAIAFLEAGGDPVAVAKALSDAARQTRILQVKGGVLQGVAITADQVKELAAVPPIEILRGQVLGAMAGPLYSIVGLFSAPLTDLVGLIDARIEQLEPQGGVVAPAAAPVEEAAPVAETEVEAEPAAEEATPVAETEVEVLAEEAETVDEHEESQETSEEG